MRLATSIAALIAFLAAATAPAATIAPHVVATSFDQLTKPLPFPYDEVANADQMVAAAKMRALKAHKRLLIDLGGNWCLDCRILAGTMKLPEIAGFVASHYEVVTVNIGRFDRNGQIAIHYGVKGRLAGVPALLIVDPKTDRLIDAGHETALSDARSMTPQALADWLAHWAA